MHADTGQWKVDLLPRIHLIDALSEAKEIRHLNHLIMAGYIKVLSLVGYHVGKAGVCRRLLPPNFLIFCCV